MDREAFVAQFGGVFEHSPWVAECAWERRPFCDRDALHAAMAACVREAEPARQMALIRAHPDLVGRAAREGRLGAASTAEQAGAGLDRLDAAQVAWFESRNRAYQERFGFPFIICVRANRRQAIIDGFETRLQHSPEQEKPRRWRRSRKSPLSGWPIWSASTCARSDDPSISARHGPTDHPRTRPRPGHPGGRAAHRTLADGGRAPERLKTVRTNADGRTDEPSAGRGGFRAGQVRTGLLRRRLFRPAGGGPFPRPGAGPVSHHRRGRALPCPAADDAVGLPDLSWKLKNHGRPYAGCLLPTLDARGGRVLQRIDALAAISETDDGLTTRTFGSDAMRRANALVGEWMRAAGLRVQVDGIGNLRGFEPPDGRPLLLLGSHLDTVREAGRFDGPLGVIAALACREAAAALRAAVPAGRRRVQRRGRRALRHGLPGQRRAGRAARSTRRASR